MPITIASRDKGSLRAWPLTRMATIGHALIGLTLGEICPAKTRANKLNNIWLGLMVAAAFLVDFAEWVSLFFVPPDHDKHFITHSPLIAGSIAAALILIIAIFTRMRSPWPYLLIAIAVMSHLPLDTQWGRAFIAEAYGFTFETRAANYVEGAVAEAWIYGFLLVEVTLILAMRDPHAPQKFRKIALILAILAAASAASRTWWIWSPVYLFALLHVALLWRSKFNRHLLWSLVPVLPLLAVPITQGAAGFLTNRAIAMRESGNIEGALRLNQFILALPSRKSFVTNYLEISRCNDALANPAASEAALQNAVNAAYDYSIHRPRFFLAKFYMNTKWRGTPYYRPQEAAQILRTILQESDNPEELHWANGELELLRKRGETN